MIRSIATGKGGTVTALDDTVKALATAECGQVQLGDLVEVFGRANAIPGNQNYLILGLRYEPDGAEVRWLHDQANPIEDAIFQGGQLRIAMPATAGIVTKPGALSVSVTGRMAVGAATVATPGECQVMAIVHKGAQ